MHQHEVMDTVQWEVDDRQPTLYTRGYIKAMWLARDKHAFEGAQHTLEQARRQQSSGDAPPTRWTRARTRTSVHQVADTTVWTVRPRHRSPRVRVLYLHGGGYVHPLTPDYWRLVRALSRTPAEVLVPAYPLAPDATVDDVLPRLVEIATGVTGDELPLVLMGDSAGGALVLVLAQRMRDLGVEAPDLVVALSPWLDATLSEPSVEGLESTDPMLAESGLRAAGRWWAGRHGPTDPAVSPLEGSLHALPPIELFIGDRDILRPAVDRLRDLAQLARARLHVHEVRSMFHVWMTRAIPEASRTRRQLVALLRGASGR